MTAGTRADVISSFTVIKGSLLPETYEVFQRWRLDRSKKENLDEVREGAWLTGGTANWRRDVAWVLNRRFEPEDRDRNLVRLAQAGCPREAWDPLVLWHITRDEFLVRDFLVRWLFAEYQAGTFRLRPADVAPYLDRLAEEGRTQDGKPWSESTRSRVASGLLQMAADFGLLSGGSVREFRSTHLRDRTFLYLVHELLAATGGARRALDAPDWHMYLLDAPRVEEELLRLHQFQKVRFERAGSLVEVKLPHSDTDAFADAWIAEELSA